ncbi:isochorismatase family protein [Pontibacillus yanchengensis]|uniref:Isochorismatase family protein n=2 Tax=Pontibacillus yanchengensis TaxID=462910 RepID=A0ACC7VIG8_9BACI|nr:isochorismatase family cysteine hydrolase [Pontibacillus yanchengensis]MYL33899.1 isochorismatase family protein [Pontibacillus yanchengensis]MYL53924.1 isochorismatase family protein [Pontibacillus yanchengensis]
MEWSKTAVVLIDLQKESQFGINGLEEVISNTSNLVAEAREHNLPIIYTRQINRADQVGLSNGEPLKDNLTPFYYSTDTEDIEIFDEIKPDTNDIIIDKHRWSAFYETNLDLYLRSMNIENLIIGGLVTDGCLMTSVFDAYFRDYQVNLVKDICGTSNEGAHMSSILIMANWVYDMKIYNTDELIKHLNGKEHTFWEASAPDSMQFTPESMREIYSKLDER